MSKPKCANPRGVLHEVAEEGQIDSWWPYHSVS
jgi:hypothetical protein